VRNVEFDAIASSNVSPGAVYLPAAQSPLRGMSLVVKSAVDTASTTAAIRRVLAGIDPSLPFYSVKTLGQYVDQALLSRRVPMLLAGAFAIVALLLSSVGIYGVLAYGVAQRRREIGIRLALGSTTRSIFRLILQEGATIVAIGLALGFAGLVALRHALLAVLYGVTPLAPEVVVAVTFGLAAVALLATVIPARRASRVSPATALLD
jgi:ABC-type antimicrobial peptide transport system permease subunit